MEQKEYSKNWKKLQRELNSDYAKKQRDLKNSEKSKERRRELRQRESSKEKEKLYQREYRKRPEVIEKNKARHAVKYALISGILKRPTNCELCGDIDKPLKDGRSGLRADHYLGYEKENHLNVKFVCLKCDGNNLKKYK